MFQGDCEKRLRRLVENRKLFVIPAVFILLMMVVISFSQVAMEIYAYTFIANKTVESRKLIQHQMVQVVSGSNTGKQNGNGLETFKNNTGKQNTDKVQNKSTDEKSMNAKKGKVQAADVNSSVLSFVMPLKGGVTSSCFGDTVSRTVKHIGHDWAVDTGTKIVASESGVVDRAYYSTSYGYNVLINHGHGIKTRYAHLSEVDVIEGQHVTKNQMIGLSGNTGDSTGPHLHFEVIVNGKCCNPLNYLR